MLNYRLWDKEEKRFLSEHEYEGIGIRYDGRVIEFMYNVSSLNDGWIETEDVTDKYEIHINAYEELSK